ncbi:MAG TPA: hypothetical protein EYP10_07475, partial [Armatimonadetes bacterium]|nr:hypothetical protein [Armatimonadota bacterium]
MFRAHQLYLLQQIDLRLENLEREFQELDDGSDLEKRLRYHEERIAEMREKLRSTRRDVADRELALRGIEEKLEKLRAIARSGVIRNPREVVRMEQELKELDRQR